MLLSAITYPFPHATIPKLHSKACNYLYKFQNSGGETGLEMENEKRNNRGPVAVVAIFAMLHKMVS